MACRFVNINTNTSKVHAKDLAHNLDLKCADCGRCFTQNVPIVGTTTMNKATHPTMRELMPKGFLPQLCKDTGTANLSNMSQVVNLENSRSAAWPFVLALAEKTNPDGFAEWAAANPDKLPKVAA